MKKTIFSFIVIVLFAFVGCQEQESVLNSDFQNESNNSLAKKSWQYTSSSWPSSSVTVDPNCYTWNRANVTLNVSFMGYNFSFTRGNGEYLMEASNYSVIVKVNGTQVATVTDPVTSNFTFNGLNMSVLVYEQPYYIYNSCQSRTMNLIEPTSVDIGIEGYVSPDAPTGFSVSPTFHPGTSANPVLSWSQTSDNDVTHVLIFRRNNAPTTSYSLLATISSSNTSYTDYSCDWNLPIGRTYTYKIAFKDATHNLTSPNSSEEFSSSL